MSNRGSPSQRRFLRLTFALAFLVLGLTAVGLRLHLLPARAQPASGDSLLQQLAERLLSAAYGLEGSGSLQLFPGALAPDFPPDVPLPPGSTLIGSDERPSLAPPHGPPGPVPGGSIDQRAITGIAVDVLVDAGGSPDDLIAFYKTAMNDLGWSLAPFQTPAQPGFAGSTTPAPPARFCRSSDTASLMVTAQPADSGPMRLRLNFDTGFGAGAICHPSVLAAPPTVPPTPAPLPWLGVLPSLEAPQGVTVHENGNAGGRSRFTTDAIAVTDMSVADLHAFYANELAGAGWIQVDSGDDDSLSWSTWSIPGHGDVQGFLYVRDGTATGQRSLHAEVSSTDPNAQSATGGYSYGGGFSSSPGSAAAVRTPPAPTETPTPTPGP